MNWLNDLRKIKIYALFCALAIGIYYWAAITGHKLTGDDNEVKEQSTGSQHGHSNFYHK
jgi:hypothetical protein